MSIWIHHIETAVPDKCYNQEAVGRQMLAWTHDERDKRLVRILYRSSGIETRHSVIPDWGDDFFIDDGQGSFHQPGTAQRNAIYSREATSLAVELGRSLLRNAKDFTASVITHVITASCTGFFNPGIDYFLCQELGLASNTQRFHLGFMGCYAAFPALNMAAQFCRANPDAVVLVMCLELCSLHLQLGGNEDSILANSLFADGAGAMLVSAREPRPDRISCRIVDFHSALVPDGQEAMAWSIGDLGFDISLSSYVPKIIGAKIHALLQPLLTRNQLTLQQIRNWAVHPGGKSIVDKVAAALRLSTDQVHASREVLRRFGNMSSATILFVLQDILAQQQGEQEGLQGAQQEHLCAMAFGPGLTVETALFQLDRGADSAS